VPVAVELRFAMPRPKSHFGAKGLKPSAPQFHAGKPDVDNLAKLLLDRITRSERIWRDDSQVVQLEVSKAYGARAGCIVILGPASSPDPLLRLDMGRFID
jgi:Holliday junction resolvase RusA-like endonuclease